jgi:hypothetical protein
MDYASLKQIPKFDGERKHFAVWLTKATGVCALNGVSSTLKPGFKDMLSANEAIPLDKGKPDEFQLTVNKNANTADWPNSLAWKLIEKLCAKFKPSDSKDEAIATVTAFNLIVPSVERVDTMQGTVPSMTRSNANTVVN